MKSCSTSNYLAQSRRGISQLLEYRYRHRELVGEDATLLLVLEIPPPPRLAWLVGYMASLGIICSWKDPDGDRLVTNTTIPTSLDKIVMPDR